MSNNFDERGRAFEKKEAIEAEKLFKINAKRNRALAIWVAGLLDYDDAKTEAYIKEVIASDFKEAGDGDVLKKVHQDLNAAGKVVTEQELREKMDVLFAAAREEVAAQS